MRVAVTGADGFVGSWLVRHLEDMGDEAWSFVGPGGSTSTPSQIRLDIADQEAVTTHLARIEPEVVFHLAAISHGPTTSQEPDRALAVTVGGTIHLLAAVAGLRSNPLVVLASSAEVYRRAPSEIPLLETAPVQPSSVYGAMKASQEAMAQAFVATHALRVVVVRSFNQIGPGQQPVFAVPSFAHQLARIKLGAQEPVILVGDLDSKRDVTDVRDAVKAFRLLALRGEGGTFNLASGKARVMRELLGSLIDLSGLAVRIQSTPDRIRPTSTIVGNANLLSAATGWYPTIALGDSLRDVWEDALARNGDQSAS